jgi:hypothetical protein
MTFYKLSTESELNKFFVSYRRTKFKTDKSDQIDTSGKAFGLYSGEDRFKYLPGLRLHLMMFTWFFSAPQADKSTSN